MKFFATLFATVASIAAVSAQAQSSGPIISVTSPLMGAKYRAGTEVIIGWTDPTVETITQINLAKGKSTALTVLRTIANNVPTKDMKYTWTVPKDLPDGDDYAFEFGTSPNIAFAGPFTIEGGSGTATSGSTPGAAPAPANPGSPTSGGSAAATPAAPSSGQTSTTSSTGATTSHSASAGNAIQICPKIILGIAGFAAYQLL